VINASLEAGPDAISYATRGALFDCRSRCSIGLRASGAQVHDNGRLRSILLSRARRALQFPYGNQAVRLGLAKPPPDDDPPPEAVVAIVAPVN